MLGLFLVHPCWTYLPLVAQDARGRGHQQEGDLRRKKSCQCCLRPSSRASCLLFLLCSASLCPVQRKDCVPKYSCRSRSQCNYTNQPFIYIHFSISGDKDREGKKSKVSSLSKNKKKVRMEKIKTKHITQSCLYSPQEPWGEETQVQSLYEDK